MKSKILSKARIISAVLVLLTIGLVTGFAESIEQNGCPEGTGGFATKGIRTKKECTQSVTERGYWWYIHGDVKWVGTIIADAGGRFEESLRTITYVGQEYTCIGSDKICWVCNCYYASPTVIEK